MNDNLSIKEKNSYSEVLEVLKNMSIEDYEKIPKNIIEMFEEYSNKDYDFKYDYNKKFEEQNLSKDAKLILAILFRDYWALPEQKKVIIAKQNFDRMQVEKQKKHNYDELFKSKAREKQEELVENNSMIEYKDTFVKRIINKIKSIYRR